ncbi:MAG: 4Fe-4S dicluster domain-containing protein [Thermoguttaceae bacterium]
MFFLKPLRVIAAVLFFTAITLFFLDYSGSLPLQLHHLAQIQMIPAILGGTLIAVAIWVVLTFLFGRLYCSIICPLGVAQDVISRTAKTVRPKKKYRFNQVHPLLRYGLLALLVIGLFVNISVFVTVLDPYANFGRIVTSLFRPIVLLGNNVLAGISHSFGNYTWVYMPINVSITAVLVALAALILVSYMSWLTGRRFCNSLCPVGTLLGLFSRNSLYRIRLKASCIGCTLCETVCKGECIDSKNRVVHADRCVACFNCLSVCKKEAIMYGTARQIEIGREFVLEQPLVEVKQAVERDQTVGRSERVVQPFKGAERRTVLGRLVWSVLGLTFIAGFLKGVRLTATESGKGGSTGTIGSIGKTGGSGGLTELPLGESRVGYKLTHPVFPPGGMMIGRFHHHCNGCQLCVSKCPSGILTPASTEYGIQGFQQPVVKFRHGFCNYDCTICTQVCPNHALRHLTKLEKHQTQIGQVCFLEENCVVKTQETNCGACAEHCPTGAVKMVPYGKPELSLKIPEITAELCVGCGACEYICPVRPYRAIYVDGNTVHTEAKLAYDPHAEQEVLEVEDFGF